MPTATASQPARWLIPTPAACPYPWAVAAALPDVLAPSAAHGPPLVAVYRPPRHLLLGPRDRRLPGIQAALRWLGDIGWPAYFRSTGGSAVVVDDGCLSLVAAWQGSDFVNWQRHFLWMGGILTRALGSVGVATRLGSPPPGAYCAGPYDLLWAPTGRKLAGIAQAVRQGAVLLGAILPLTQPPTTAIALLQEFYRVAGSPRPLRADAVTNLAGAGGPADPDTVTAALQAAWAECWQLEPDRLTAAEWAEAQRHVTAQDRAAP